MTAQRRLNTLLLIVFGAVAAIVAAVGVYGVLAYSVQQRRRELGVRIALGATSASLLRLVLAEGLALAGTGLVLGLIAALALGRVLTSLLYGVSATGDARRDRRRRRGDGASRVPRSGPPRPARRSDDSTPGRLRSVIPVEVKPVGTRYDVRGTTYPTALRAD
jgi:ABC-type antimicrobial peptide transport system permease subunit